MTVTEVQEEAKRLNHELLDEYFVYNSDGNRVYPNDVFRQLRHESEEQTKALRSFSTDLADGIVISSATIQALGDRIGDILETRLTPHLEKLDSAVQSLQDEKVSSNKEMVSDVVENLSHALEEIGKEFQQALSGGALDQMETMANLVADTGATLASIPEKFDELTRTLTEHVEEISRKTGEEAQIADHDHAPGI